MTIRKLSAQLANQIAAGEVVERPSSVVKELMENAIDSKANKIIVEIKKSGRVLIKVTDNGEGICKDELHLALAPHATSKIYTLEDLNAIVTMGFRGEALASIASVSKLVLTSKRECDEHGHAVFVEGLNQDPTVYPKAHATGTTVEVSELFFNTPARRRFLKSDRTEFLHIKDIFIKEALAHNDIAFDFISDGKHVFSVKGAKDKDDLKKRIAKLIEINLDSAKYIKESNEKLSIEGFLLPPVSLEKSLSDSIYLFLNNRPIADRVVIHAIRQAFNSIIKSKSPIRCVFYINIDPKLVDINVHPSKDEVRFVESQAVHDFVFNTIEDALITLYDLDFDDFDKKLDLSDVDAHKDDANKGLNSLFKEESKSPLIYKDSNYLSKSDVESKVFNLSSFTQDKDVFIDGNSKDNDKIESNNADELEENVDLESLNEGALSTSDFKKDKLLSLVKDKEDLSKISYTHDLIDEIVDTQESETKALSLDEDSFSLNDDNKSILAVDSIDDKERITIISIPNPNVVFVKILDRYYLIKIDSLINTLGALEYKQDFNFNTVKTRELNIPFSLKADKDILKFIRDNYKTLVRMGFLFKIKQGSFEVKYLPEFVKGFDLASFIQNILKYLKQNKESFDKGLMPMSFALFVYKNNDIKIIDKESIKEKLINLRDLSFLDSLDEKDVQELDLVKLSADFLKEV